MEVVQVVFDAVCLQTSRGTSSQSNYQDLRQWHSHLASRVGQAVSRLQQLSSDSQQ